MWLLYVRYYECCNMHRVAVQKHLVVVQYSETSLIRHSMGPENNVGLGGCWIIECLLPYWSMVTVPHNGWIRECWIIKVTD